MDAEYMNRRLDEEYVKLCAYRMKIFEKDFPIGTRVSALGLMEVWEEGFRVCINLLNSIAAEEKEQSAAWLRSHEPVTPNTDIKKHIKAKRRTT